VSGSEVRWGILATGSIARAFADALVQARNARLTAVASRSLERSRAFVQPYADVRAYGTYEGLLGDAGVDAVYVATPHPEHAEWTLRALGAGKAVLCEKPLGVNHAEAMAMVDAAERQGRFLMEAFMYRCHPQTGRLMTLLRDGAVGEVRHLEASFGFHAPFRPQGRLFANALAGGGMLDVGCYPLSAARLVMGAEPQAIAAHGRLGETGVDEWSAALLKFDGGVAAQIATGVRVGLANSLAVYGSAGRIHVPRPWRCADSAGNWSFELCREGREPERIAGSAPPLFVLEAEHASERIAAGALESPRMSWADTLGNAQALDAWRAEVGLEYEQERPAAHRGPLLGRPPQPRRDGSMQHGRIGGLDKPVARLVMGCDNQPSMSHAAVMWDHYFEEGGNAFDTAYVYGRGRTERLLGHWHASRGVRDRMVIVGKGAHTPECDPQAIAPQLSESLERLQTDHVDVYFLHRDNPDVPVGEFVDALNAEVAAGRIGVFGGSNWQLERVVAANEYAERHGVQGFAAVSNQFSLARMVEPIWPGVESATDEAFRRYLARSGMALMPWSSQARGFFTPWAERALEEDEAEPPAITTMQPTVAELRRVWRSPENLARRARAVELARAEGVEPINVALAYVLRQPFPTYPLIGPRTLAETRSCLRAFDLHLSPERLAWLDAG